MARHRPSLRGTAAVVVVLAALSLLAVGQRPAYTDDIDLLRFTTAKPYVFFLIDNSASMNMAPDGKWVHANGDDPRSKMYQVKQVSTTSSRTSTTSISRSRRTTRTTPGCAAKHWLYYFVSSASNKLPAGWPIAYPAADNDGPVVTAASGAVTGDIEGDLMTFGAHLDATGSPGPAPRRCPAGPWAPTPGRRSTATPSSGRRATARPCSGSERRRQQDLQADRGAPAQEAGQRQRQPGARPERHGRQADARGGQA